MEGEIELENADFELNQDFEEDDKHNMKDNNDEMRK